MFYVPLGIIGLKKIYRSLTYPLGLFVLTPKPRSGLFVYDLRQTQESKKNYGRGTWVPSYQKVRKFTRVPLLRVVLNLAETTQWHSAQQLDIRLKSLIRK
jgi:hypothetical protein